MVTTRVIFIFNIIPKVIPSLLRAYLDYCQRQRTQLSITITLKYKLKAWSAIYLRLVRIQ